MDELIVKRLRGRATDIEGRQLDHWRAESSENEAQYRAFVRHWQGTGEPNPPTVGPAPDLEEILRNAGAGGARGQARAAWRAVVRWRWAPYGLAGAAAAILTFLAVRSDGARDSTTRALFPVETSSGSGDITTLGLSDGSVVRVVPETRVEFPSSVDRREVVLEGRAFFAVTAGPTPFVIRTHVGEVTVHGTRFEISTNGDELRVVVVEGRVRLDGQAGVADVGAGQMAYLGLGSSPRILDHGDVWSVLEWPQGLLIYEDTPLTVVAEELSHHFGRDVTVSDGDLGRVRITAWFEDEPLEDVISAVCLVAVATCDVREAQVTIGR